MTETADATPRSTNTVFIWLITLMPILVLVPLFTVDWASYARSIASPSTLRETTIDSLSILLSPGYVVALGLNWIVFALTVVFAVLDTRELKRRQVSSPFHWAFAFLGSLVYVVGRSVIVKMRTGRGLGPIWGEVGVLVASFIFSIYLTLVITQAVLEVIPTTAY